MDLKHAKSSAGKTRKVLMRMPCKQQGHQPVVPLRKIEGMRSQAKLAPEATKPQAPSALTNNRNSKEKRLNLKAKQALRLTEEELRRKIGTRKMYTQYEQPPREMVSSLSKITVSQGKGKNIKRKRQKEPRHTVQGARISRSKEAEAVGSRGSSAGGAKKEGKAHRLLSSIINSIKSSQQTLTTALSEKHLNDNSGLDQENRLRHTAHKTSHKRPAKPLHQTHSPNAKSNKPEIPPRKESTCQLDCPEDLEPIALTESKRYQPPSDSDSKHLSIVRTAMQQTLPGDLFACQPQLSSKIRAVLVDWVLRITSEMLMQRQTVSLALHYLDEYVQKVAVEKSRYQLMAVAALLIAYKQEHSHADKLVQVLLASCEHGYSQQELLEAEMQLALRLEFRLNPPTYNFWLEYFTSRWDRYLQKGKFQTIVDQTSEQLIERFTTRPLLFREAMPHSYGLYRELMQLLDTALYCEATVRRFERPKLVVAGMYLMLRCNLDAQVELERMLMEPSHDRHMVMWRQFQQPNSPIFRDRLQFNPLFNHFLTELCTFQLADIVPEVKYLAGFLSMPFSTSLPDGLCSCEQVSGSDNEDDLRAVPTLPTAQ